MAAMEDEMPLGDKKETEVTNLKLIEGEETSWSKRMLDRIFTNGWKIVSNDSPEAQTALPVQITKDGAPWLVKILFEEGAVKADIPAVTY